MVIINVPNHLLILLNSVTSIYLVIYAKLYILT